MTHDRDWLATVTTIERLEYEKASMNSLLLVEEWDEQHPRWHEVLQVVEHLNQLN
jgi:hypothetical protein